MVLREHPERSRRPTQKVVASAAATLQNMAKTSRSRAPKSKPTKGKKRALTLSEEESHSQDSMSSGGLRDDRRRKNGKNKQKRAAKRARQRSPAEPDEIEDLDDIPDDVESVVLSRAPSTIRDAETEGDRDDEVSHCAVLVAPSLSIYLFNQ